jgi:hypothetical protein
MAISKSTRRHPDDTRRRIQSLFQKSHVSKERRRAWYSATAHLEAGVDGLRFPIYERLYNFNLYAQKLADLVEEISESLSIPPDDAHYHQYLIQQIRSSITSDVLDQMADIEHIEGWLFESLRRTEERKLRDPEDIYLMVREQETERAGKGIPPRIHFLDDDSTGQEGASARSNRAITQRPSRKARKAKENRHA